MSATREVARVGYSIEALLGLMRALRSDQGGCPWDREQTHQSLARFTIEEAHEAAQAMRGTDAAELCDELGDLLLQVVFHAQIASEAGTFSFPDVVRSICEKMTRRHPHVFGLAASNDEAARQAVWEADKVAARNTKAEAGQSVLDGVPATLPALMRADKLARRAAQVGFDWKESDRVWDKIDEEFAELREAVTTGDADRIEDEMGDVLFVLTNLARHLGVDAETALQRTNEKFTRRFKGVEHRAAERGMALKSLRLEDMERFWAEVKLAERKGD
ncbi:MAG TPA: nucleoside triphosphate pyrophosphohydrolase [Alphaproteobacteria bacterium]|nr:nucleoside triphosphate pyrophosphohydrolase [Alphaproteobacteria bacterium]HAJ46405.1 nucleoside triphosphate pyrophosphohydrolase [Alphaproteobacteria bacterium]